MLMVFFFFILEALYLLGMSTICQSGVLQIFFHSVSLLKVYLEAYSKHNSFFHSINPVGELCLCHFIIVMFSLCGLVCDYPFFPQRSGGRKETQRW